jgi:O-antigen ligase
VQAAPKFVAVALIMLLMLSVLAFGAVEYWSVFALRIGTALLVFVWIVVQVVSHPHLPKPGRYGAPTATLTRQRVLGNPLCAPMGLWAGLILAQFVTGHTAYRYATLNEGLNFIAYGMLLFLAVQLFRCEWSLVCLASAFSAFGAGVALMAMAQEVTSARKLYWLRVPQHGGTIYGPYVNHNHYAGLMELLIPIPLVLCLSRADGRTQRLLCGLAALLMATSVILSGSRGGVISVVAEFVFLVGFICTRERRRRSASLKKVAAVGGLLIALLIGLGSAELWSRMASLAQAYDNEVVGGRWALYRDGFHMWMQRPWLGWGLGTFPVVYPQFQSFSSDLVVNQAHNDVLQVAVEAGVAGFFVLILFVLLLYRNGLADASLHRSKSSVVRLGALIGCTGLLVHSLTDFNLHIPANAALFFFFAAIATGNSEDLPDRLSIC